MTKLRLVIITVLITILVLFVINYFTLLGLRLPHKSQVIYTWEYGGDIFARMNPAFIEISVNASDWDYGLKLIEE